MDRFGGRRFLMVMGCGMVATALCYLEKLSGSEFVTLVTLTIVPYLGFNTQQHIQGTK